MKGYSLPKERSGFTIIEVMVAMVVLAIGLLGMAGMTLMVMKGGTDASRMTYATNLASDRMESLKDVAWDNLGAAANSGTYGTSTVTCNFTNANALIQGCSGGLIMVETGLNQQGLTAAATPTPAGPFAFTRRWVVCQDGLTKLISSPAPVDNCESCSGPGEPACTADENRPDLLSCDDANVQPDEKRVRILVTWRDKSGRCHSVHMQSVLADLN